MRALLFMSLFFVLLPAAAQQPAAASGDGVQKPGAEVKPEPPEWRKTEGYRFPAVAKTVEDMQNLAYAMQLREFCANPRVADDFVRERLDRFGAMTGREESCQTLLDY
ncbi:hypothetical protein [Thauera linaloolentis]|nr:hypothetical protein [Thauera linaloolentis]MCM8567000.1 hypothetical protein [Thauera linaloolentis]